MRVTKASSAAACLLLLAVAPFAVSVTRADGDAEPKAARDSPRAQDAATPLPGTRCTSAYRDRCKRPGAKNNAPVVELRASEQEITLACPEGATSQTCAAGDGTKTQLQATAADPDGDSLLYTYSVTGGRTSGDGAEVTWDLTGVRPGTYTANVEVDDCCGCVAFSSVQIKVEACGDCNAPRR